MLSPHLLRKIHGHTDISIDKSEKNRFHHFLFACVLHNTPKKLPFPVQITLCLCVLWEGERDMVKLMWFVKSI